MDDTSLPPSISCRDTGTSGNRHAEKWSETERWCWPAAPLAGCGCAWMRKKEGKVRKEDKAVEVEDAGASHQVRRFETEVRTFGMGRNIDGAVSAARLTNGDCAGAGETAGGTGTGLLMSAAVVGVGCSAGAGDAGREMSTVGGGCGEAAPDDDDDGATATGVMTGEEARRVFGSRSMDVA